MLTISAARLELLARHANRACRWPRFRESVHLGINYDVPTRAHHYPTDDFLPYHLKDSLDFVNYANRILGLFTPEMHKTLEEISAKEISREAAISLADTYLESALRSTTFLIDFERLKNGIQIPQVNRNLELILSKICKARASLLKKTMSGKLSDLTERIIEEAKIHLKDIPTLRDKVEVHYRDSDEDSKFMFAAMFVSVHFANAMLNIRKDQLKPRNFKVRFTDGSRTQTIDTGMSKYIDVDEPYALAQKFHAGRNEAREQIVIPILIQHLRNTTGNRRIVDMGPADGLTSTVRFAEGLSDTEIIALELDDKYFERLKFNLRNFPQVRPLNKSVADYEPDVPNSVDAFVSLGGFTDFNADQNKWVEVLRNIRERVLKPKGLVILEEEVCPYYDPKVPFAREKALAIQRGDIIFDGLIRGKIKSVGREELKALMSSLSGCHGDYKGRLVDFKRVFKEAGYPTLHWVKVYPLKEHKVANLNPENLQLGKDWRLFHTCKARRLTALDFYNELVNSLLQIDHKIEEVDLSYDYYSAWLRLNELNLLMQKHNGHRNLHDRLKDELDLEIIDGQNLTSKDNLEDDHTGGVYVLIAQAP